MTDGTKDTFQGTGCYFLRTTMKAITPQNLYNEVYFAVFNSSILSSLTSVVKSVIVPALKAQVCCAFLLLLFFLWRLDRY